MTSVRACEHTRTCNLDLACVTSRLRHDAERRARYVLAAEFDADRVPADVIGRVRHGVRAVAVVLYLGSHVT